METIFNQPNDALAVRLHHLILTPPHSSQYITFNELFRLLKLHLFNEEHINYIESSLGSTYLMSACSTIHFNPTERIELIYWLLDNGLDLNIPNSYTKKTALHYLLESIHEMNNETIQLIYDIIVKYNVDLNAVDASIRIPITYLASNIYLSITPLFIFAMQMLFSHNPEAYPLEHQSRSKDITFYVFGNRKYFDIQWPKNPFDFNSPDASKLNFTLPTYQKSTNENNFSNLLQQFTTIQQSINNLDEIEWKLYKYYLFDYLRTEQQSVNSTCDPAALTHPHWYVQLNENPLSIELSRQSYSRSSYVSTIPLPIHELFTQLPLLDPELTHDPIYHNNNNNNSQLTTSTTSTTSTSSSTTLSQSKSTSYTTRQEQIPINNNITNPLLPPIAMIRCLFTYQPDLFVDCHQHIMLMLQAHQYLTPYHIDLIKLLLILRKDYHHELYVQQIADVFMILFRKTYTIPSPQQLKLLQHIFYPSKTIGDPNYIQPIDFYGIIPPYEKDWSEEMIKTRTDPYIDLIHFIFAILEQHYYKNYCPKRNPTADGDHFEDQLSSLIQYMLFITATSQSSLHQIQIKPIHETILYYTPFSNKYINMPYLVNLFDSHATEQIALKQQQEELERIQVEEDIKRRETERLLAEKQKELDEIQNELLNQETTNDINQVVTSDGVNQAQAPEIASSPTSSSSTTSTTTTTSHSDSDLTSVLSSGSNSGSSSDSDSSDSDSSSNSDSDSSDSDSDSSSSDDDGPAPLQKLRLYQQQEKSRIETEITALQIQYKTQHDTAAALEWKYSFIPQPVNTQLIPFPLQFNQHQLQQRILSQDTPLIMKSYCHKYPTIDFETFFTPQTVIIDAIFKPMDGSMCGSNLSSFSTPSTTTEMGPYVHKIQLGPTQFNPAHCGPLKNSIAKLQTQLTDVMKLKVVPNQSTTTTTTTTTTSNHLTGRKGKQKAVQVVPIDPEVQAQSDILETNYLNQLLEVVNPTSDRNTLFWSCDPNVPTINPYTQQYYQPREFVPYDEFVISMIESNYPDCDPTAFQPSKIVPKDFNTNSSIIQEATRIYTPPILQYGFAPKLLTKCNIDPHLLHKRQLCNELYYDTYYTTFDGQIQPNKAQRLPLHKDIGLEPHATNDFVFTRYFDIPLWFNIQNYISFEQFGGTKNNSRNTAMFNNYAIFIQVLLIWNNHRNFDELVEFMNIYAEYFELYIIPDADARQSNIYRQNWARAVRVHYTTPINAIYLQFLASNKDKKLTPTAVGQLMRETQRILYSLQDKIGHMNVNAQLGTHTSSSLLVESTKYIITNFYSLIDDLDPWFYHPLATTLKWIFEYTSVMHTSQLFHHVSKRDNNYSDNESNSFYEYLLRYGRFQTITDENCDELWYYLRHHLDLKPHMSITSLRQHAFDLPHIKSVYKQYGDFMSTTLLNVSKYDDDEPGLLFKHPVEKEYFIKYAYFFRNCAEQANAQAAYPSLSFADPQHFFRHTKQRMDFFNTNIFLGFYNHDVQEEYLQFTQDITNQIHDKSNQFSSHLLPLEQLPPHEQSKLVLLYCPSLTPYISNEFPQLQPDSIMLTAHAMRLMSNSIEPFSTISTIPNRINAVEKLQDVFHETISHFKTDQFMPKEHQSNRYLAVLDVLEKVLHPLNYNGYANPYLPQLPLALGYVKYRSENIDYYCPNRLYINKFTFRFVLEVCLNYLQFPVTMIQSELFLPNDPTLTLNPIPNPYVKPILSSTTTTFPSLTTLSQQYYNFQHNVTQIPPRDLFYIKSKQPIKLFNHHNYTFQNDGELLMVDNNIPPEIESKLIFNTTTLQLASNRDEIETILRQLNWSPPQSAIDQYNLKTPDEYKSAQYILPFQTSTISAHQNYEYPYYESFCAYHEQLRFASTQVLTTSLFSNPNHWPSQIQQPMIQPSTLFQSTIKPYTSELTIIRSALPSLYEQFPAIQFPEQLDLLSTTAVDRFESNIEGIYTDYIALHSTQGLLSSTQTKITSILQGFFINNIASLPLSNGNQLGQCYCSFDNNDNQSHTNCNIYTKCPNCIEREQCIFNSTFSGVKRVNPLWSILTFNFFMRYIIPIFFHQLDNIVPLRGRHNFFADVKPNTATPIILQSYPNKEQIHSTPLIPQNDELLAEQADWSLSNDNELNGVIPLDFFLFPFFNTTYSNFDIIPQLSSPQQTHQLNPFELSIAYILSTFRQSSTFQSTINVRQEFSHIYNSTNIQVALPDQCLEQTELFEKFLIQLLSKASFALSTHPGYIFTETLSRYTKSPLHPLLSTLSSRSNKFYQKWFDENGTRIIYRYLNDDIPAYGANPTLSNRIIGIIKQFLPFLASAAKSRVINAAINSFATLTTSTGTKPSYISPMFTWSKLALFNPTISNYMSSFNFNNCSITQLSTLFSTSLNQISTITEDDEIEQYQQLHFKQRLQDDEFDSSNQVLIPLLDVSRPNMNEVLPSGHRAIEFLASMYGLNGASLGRTSNMLLLDANYMFIQTSSTILTQQINHFFNNYQHHIQHQTKYSNAVVQDDNDVNTNDDSIYSKQYSVTTFINECKPNLFQQQQIHFKHEPFVLNSYMMLFLHFLKIARYQFHYHFDTIRPDDNAATSLFSELLSFKTLFCPATSQFLKNIITTYITPTMNGIDHIMTINTIEKRDQQGNFQPHNTKYANHTTVAEIFNSSFLDFDPFIQYHITNNNNNNNEDDNNQLTSLHLIPSLTSKQHSSTLSLTPSTTATSKPASTIIPLTTLSYQNYQSNLRHEPYTTITTQALAVLHHLHPSFVDASLIAFIRDNPLSAQAAHTNKRHFQTDKLIESYIVPNRPHFDTLLQSLSQLLATILNFPLQTPIQLQFIQWLSNYSRIHIFPSVNAAIDVYLSEAGGVFRGDKFHSLLTKKLSGFSLKKILGSSISTYYQSKLLHTLIYSTQLQLQATADMKDYSNIEDPLGLLATSYQKDNKYWLNQFQTVLSSGGLFTTQHWFNALSFVDARKEIVTNVPLYHGNHRSSLLSCLPIKPTNDRVEFYLWQLVERYTMFQLLPKNRFHTPLDALCGHPVIEISTFFTKVKHHIYKCHPTMFNTSSTTSSTTTNNISMSLILDTITNIVDQYHHSLQELQHLIASEEQSLLQASQTIVTGSNVTLTHEAKLLQKVQSNQQAILLLSFINDWRYCIEVILPSIDLYPNYAPSNDILCSCDVNGVSGHFLDDTHCLSNVKRKCLIHLYQQSARIGHHEALIHINHQSHPTFINEPNHAPSCLDFEASLPNLRILNQGTKYQPNSTNIINNFIHEFGAIGDESLTDSIHKKFMQIHYDSDAKLNSFSTIMNNLQYSLAYLVSSGNSWERAYGYFNTTKPANHLGKQRCGTFTYFNPIPYEYLQFTVDTLHPISTTHNFVQIETTSLPPLTFSTQIEPHNDFAVHIGPIGPVITDLKCPEVEKDTKLLAEPSFWEVSEQIIPLPKYETFDESIPNNDDIIIVPHSDNHDYSHQPSQSQEQQLTEQIAQLLPNSLHMHQPMMVSYHLPSNEHLPYWKTYTPTFTSGLLWYLISSTTLSLDDLVALLSTELITLYNPCTNVNHLNQTIIHLCLLQRLDSRILMALWNSILSPHVQYTMDYTSYDLIQNILFYKDAFGWTLLDYIRFVNAKLFANDFVDMILSLYQTYDPTIVL